MTTIYLPGDTAKYTGEPQGIGTEIIINGDTVTVQTGNIEPEDDVWVTLNNGTPIPVSATDLKWISGS